MLGSSPFLHQSRSWGRWMIGNYLYICIRIIEFQILESQEKHRVQKSFKKYISGKTPRVVGRGFAKLAETQKRNVHEFLGILIPSRWLFGRGSHPLGNWKPRKKSKSCRFRFDETATFSKTPSYEFNELTIYPHHKKAGSFFNEILSIVI